MRLCNEGGCGLKWLTSYHKVCIIIRQLHYLRQNGPNKRFNWHWKVKNCKCLSGRSSSLEIAKLLRHDHRTIEHFVAISQQGRKKRTEKKMLIFTTWGEPSYQEPIILQCCNIPAWSIQNCKVSSARRHSQGKEDNNHWIKLTSLSVKIGLKNTQRLIYQRFYGQMKWEWLLMDQMDGPVAGLLMDTGHHFKYGTSKVEEGHWYGLL